jgi:hypothetical protein
MNPYRVPFNSPMLMMMMNYKAFVQFSGILVIAP